MAVIRPNAEPAATAVVAGDIFLIDGATGVRALAASMVSVLDANFNANINNVNEGFASTATAAGTTTLTAASTKQQFFTGTTTQTVVLPVTSTLVLGQAFSIKNSSTGALTIQSSGGNLVMTLAPGASVTLTCIAITGTSASSWQGGGAGSVNVASGKVLTVSNSLTLAGTDGTVMTFPGTSASVARTDAAQTFTGTQTFTGAVSVTSASATAFAVGLAGVTNPAFVVNASTALQSAGLSVTGAVTGNTVALAVIDTGSGTNLSINAKGAGTIAIGNVSTGAVILTPAVTLGSTLNNVTITPAASTATLTIGSGKTHVVSNSITLAGTDGTVMTFPGTSDTVVTLAAAQALTNKTINGNTFTAGTGVLTIAAAKTLAVSNSLTFAGTDGTTQTFPATSGTVVTSVSSNVITNAMRAQMTAATLKGNVTASTANEVDFTVQGLVNLGAPSATLDFIPIYDHVSGTIKSVTPGAIASSAVAGVASIAGNTGVFTLGGLLTNSTNVLQVVAAAKTDQQTPTSNVLAVTPLHQQDHPSALKVDVAFTGSSGAIQGTAFNVASVTRTAAGAYTVNFTTPFANATYRCRLSTENVGAFTGALAQISQSSRTTTSVSIITENPSTGSQGDPATVFLECSGTQ